MALGALYWIAAAALDVRGGVSAAFFQSVLAPNPHALAARGVALAALAAGTWLARRPRRTAERSGIDAEQAAPTPATAGVAPLAPEHFAAFMAHAPSMVFLVDGTGCLRYANPAFLELAGLARDAYRCQCLDQLFPAETARTLLGDFDTVWEARAAVSVTQHVEIRGEERIWRTQLFPVRGGPGGPELLGGIALDVTLLHRAREERERLAEQLRQAQKMEAVGTLTGGIAHDFNNILAVVLANAEMLTGALPAEGEAAEALGDLRRTARQGAELVRRLMAFSRQAPLDFTRVDLARLLGDAEATLRRLLPPAISVEVEVGTDRPTVRGDVGSITQIVLNLATNARDAMPDGGRLRFEARPVQVVEADRARLGPVEPGAYVRLTVSDTGHGMDEATLLKVFEPFFTTKERGKGTGLGLAMVYGLVRQHGGALAVDSAPGRGTRFRLYFPVFEESPAPSSGERDEAGPEPMPTGNETVLVADDEEALLRATSVVLRKLGYRVLTAGDGEEAWETFQAHASEIDVVVSDLVMPKLGGVELFERIARSGSDAALVLATGHGAVEIESAAGVGRPVSLLPKPWTIGDVAAVLRSALDG